MLNVKIIILLNNVDKDICLLGKDIYNKLKIEDNKQYNIHLGQLKVRSAIKCNMNEEESMSFSEEVSNEILIYDDIILNIWRKNENIYLGPVVGVFMPINYCEEIGKGAPPLEAIEHIQEASPHERCMAYCFSVKDIDWENNRIKGYTFRVASNRWEYRWLPMADIIYDRIAHGNEEEKRLVKEERQNLRENSNIRFINPEGSLGKWPLYKKLFMYDEMHKYLPETILYKSFNDIVSMLNKYNFIFIKSSMGSRGEEVFSIEKVDGKYRIDFYNRKLKLVFVENLDLLKNYIDKFIIEKQKYGRVFFVVQQGINLIKYNGHKMDFRITLEKDEYGIWEATNYYAIHSKEHSNITNYCVGGVLHLYEDVYEVLKENYKDVYIPTKDEFGKETIKVAKYIEKQFGTYGEIGMDMAIDEDGHIWLIEGNAKPDKYRVPGIDDMEGPSPQSCAIFKYSKYLAQLRK